MLADMNARRQPVQTNPSFYSKNDMERHIAYAHRLDEESKGYVPINPDEHPERVLAQGTYNVVTDNAREIVREITREHVMTEAQRDQMDEASDVQAAELALAYSPTSIAQMPLAAQEPFMRQMKSLIGTAHLHMPPLKITQWGNSMLRNQRKRCKHQIRALLNRAERPPRRGGRQRGAAERAALAQGGIVPGFKLRVIRTNAE